MVEHVGPVRVRQLLQHFGDAVSIALNFRASYRPGRKSSTMPNQESDMQKLENQFPSASGSAFAAAREQVLASGQSVLQSEHGVIYEVFPNGTRRRVKNIEPPTPVVAGSKIQID